MDICFKTSEGRFNYRVTAIIINDNKILAMQDINAPGYYLPGGRVQMHETLIDALNRELKEELDIKASIIRPLWFLENFFELKDKKEKVHEIGVYYLVDISNTNLLNKGNKFIKQEGNVTHQFEWLDIDTLNEVDIYPSFLKDGLKNIPSSFETLVLPY